jgi:adenosylhomocysteine nucleosidase
MIAIFGALEEEVRELKKQILIKRTVKNGKSLFYEGEIGGKECLLVVTGMGKDRAERATLDVFGSYSVSPVISTGFGGSLNNRTGVGDVVVYTNLMSTTNKNNGRETIRSDPDLVSAALIAGGRSKVRVVPGKGVTAIKVYDTSDSKRRLGERFGVDMVDIESYWIGKITGTRKLPFITLRSVFDTVGDDLKVLEKVTYKGEIVRSKALSYCLKHPLEVRKLVRYSLNSQKAARNLAILIKEMVVDLR